MEYYLDVHFKNSLKTSFSEVYDLNKEYQMEYVLVCSLMHMIILIEFGLVTIKTRRQFTIRLLVRNLFTRQSLNLYYPLISDQIFASQSIATKNLIDGVKEKKTSCYLSLLRYVTVRESNPTKLERFFGSSSILTSV